MSVQPDLTPDLRRAQEAFGDPLQTALAIADEVSTYDIECGLQLVLVQAGEFYDTHLCNNADQRERIARAIRYLSLRGRVEWHPAYGNLFRLSGDTLPLETMLEAHR